MGPMYDYKGVTFKELVGAFGYVILIWAAAVLGTVLLFTLIAS